MINPATIFFLAPYSETSFLCSQLLGHYYLQSNRIFISCLCFAFGSIIRSNGIVSFGFILYYYLKQIYQQKTWIIPIHNLILCFSPFFFVQYYQYKEYCFEKILPLELKIYGLNENLPMPLSNLSSEWCLKRFPLSYHYVQKTHWNVGFINYWTWKQIPNFLLALPIFILIGRFIQNWFSMIKIDLWKEKFDYLFSKKKFSNKNLWFMNQDFLPHIIYTIFLSLFALFFMHIQVTTRFLFSSGPFLYWISTDRIKQYDIQNGNLRKIFYLFKKETFLFYYYFIYMSIGIALFVNFLPWT
jgi:phosphatidylinositol glycan class V